MELQNPSPATTGPVTLLDGRYRIGEVLGRGGVATVYSAVDVLLGRDVAVKVFRREGSRLSLYRFAAEARLLAGLSHPGLVTVHDVCLDSDQPYLVMHLVTGSTLRGLMDRGPLASVTTARVGARIAEVLAYVHTRDIVHRDVKPSNVLVDTAGAGFLADFGIARAMGAAHLTLTGELIGTAAYLAPEQVTDVDVTPKADVYALGLVLLECLTGRPEYTGTTVEAAVARLSRQPRIGEEVPAAWRGLLTAMTSREPVNRPDAATCAGLLGALVRDPLAVIPVLPLRREPKLARVGLLVAGLAGALVIGVIGSTVVVPERPSEDGSPPASTTPPVTPSRTPVAPVANSTVVGPTPPPASPPPPATPLDTQARVSPRLPDQPPR
ncbi:serine/threonine-protein kinase [Actinophytocola sediminis]